MDKIEELENRIKELENHNINNIIKRVRRLERLMFSLIFDDKEKTKCPPYDLYQ